MKSYIALGDSISIDDYPQRETGIADIGAASLFARELRSRYPGIAVHNLTADAATTDDVLRWQIPQVHETSEAAIVTITAGGNDLLMNLGARRPPVRLVEGVLERLERIIEQVQGRLPASRILLGTIYDPSDGTNELDGERFEREAAWLARVNEGIRALASRDGVVLADIHQLFLGHGITVPEKDRWYWSGLIFEPNARGAEAVAQLWTGLIGE